MILEHSEEEFLVNWNSTRSKKLAVCFKASVINIQHDFAYL